MYRQFNIQQFYVLPEQCICVLCGSENKQRLFPYTALKFVTVTKFYVLPVQWVPGLSRGKAAGAWC
jgi:hypothetical protein